MQGKGAEPQPLPSPSSRVSTAPSFSFGWWPPPRASSPPGQPPTATREESGSPPPSARTQVKPLVSTPNPCHQV